VQPGIVGIADRRNGGQAVDRAAQDYDDEPRIARLSHARRRAKGTGAAENAGARGGA
jgi:hypothetical protein